jgi:hypothetical protein
MPKQGNWTGALHDHFTARAHALDAAGRAADELAAADVPATDAAPAKPRKLKLPRKLLVDEPCEIRGPFGAPMTTALGKEHVVLVAAGIGVTPIASILKTLLDHHEGISEEGDEEEGQQEAAAEAAAEEEGAAKLPGLGRPRHSSAIRRMERSKLRRVDVFWCVASAASRSAWPTHPQV